MGTVTGAACPLVGEGALPSVVKEINAPGVSQRITTFVARV